MFADCYVIKNLQNLRTNELHCSTISENDVYSILSFKEILNKDVKAEIKREKSVSDGFKTDLFSAISL